MRLALFAPLALCGLFAATAARAEVDESLDYLYYDVYHQRGQLLHKAITRASTVSKGKGYHGFTEWKVRWNFRWNSDRSGRCHISSVNVVAEGTITLPALHTDDARAQQNFDRYIEALEAHELGHFRFAQDAAAAIEIAIGDMGERASCARLEADANALGHAILAEAIRDEKDYDLRTDHGKTQGARISG